MVGRGISSGIILPIVAVLTIVIMAEIMVSTARTALGRIIMRMTKIQLLIA